MSKQDRDRNSSALDIVLDREIRQRPLGLQVEAVAEHSTDMAPPPIPEIEDRRANKAILRCQDNLAFMKAQLDEKFKLIVTSPPYNIGKSYEVQSSLEAYLLNQKEVIGECVRVLHPAGSICWQVGNYVDNGEILPLDSLLFPIFREFGLKLRNRIIWHFGHGLHCRNRLSGRYETINWWTKGDDYTWNLDPIRVPSKYPGKRHFKGPRKGELSGNPKGKNPSDVWDFPNVKSNHPEKTIHPCQFPVELVERLVLAMTEENDDVFDPYVGVGSSAIAALKHNRNAYGCDLVEEYIAIARQRVDAFYAGTLKTRPMGKPVYDPSLPKGGH
jgi:adenine-specific DNA-methyltransferase